MRNYAMLSHVTLSQRAALSCAMLGHAALSYQLCYLSLRLAMLCYVALGLLLALLLLAMLRSSMLR